MKAVCIVEPYRVEIQERPKPVIGSPKEVLVRVVMGGICGSDVHIYHGTLPVATYPRINGHEIVGVIEETGSAVEGFAPGDRVVMDPVIYCGECYQCRIGRRNVCSKLQVRGAHTDGGYREYIVLPQSSVYHIPDQLAWEEAVLIEPFTIAEQVCSRAELRADDKVFIMGAGPVGLSALKRALLSGADCFVSDIVDSRLAMARAYGAKGVINAASQDVRAEVERLTGGGATVVVDAVCSVRSFEQALECVRAAGRVITLGFNQTPSAIAQFGITARELDIRGSRLHNNKFPDVIDLFASGRIDVKGMVTHRFPFERVQEAFRLAEDPAIEKGKVVLTF